VSGLKSQELVLVVLIGAVLSFGADLPRSLVQSAEKKFNYIHDNGQRLHPDPRPTQVSEPEVNAYLASGKVRLPAGVESLRLQGTPGVITAHCRVDFDRVRAGRGNPNPLLQLLSGVHDVVAEAQASGSNHQGRVRVNSVAIDGIQVPRFVLQIFADKYVTPRYPGVGLDSTFALPEKIETATVGSHVLTVAQQ
jgi:hypothetical protein